MALQFSYLADDPDLVPQVISWWHTIWADRMGPDLEAARKQLRDSLGTDELPIHVLAEIDGEAVGTAVLKLQELGDLYPDCQYWLGSVFVEESRRHQGIAAQLVGQIIALAQSRQLPHLYLQTVNLSGGLYAKLGWQPVEEFDYRGTRTLLMYRAL